MPDTKISAELHADALDGTELTEVVQAGNNRKTTTQDIANLARPSSTTGSGAAVLQTGAALISPTLSGTVAGLENIPNTVLQHSSITIAGHSVNLGGSQTLAATDLLNGTTGSGDIVLASAPTLNGTIVGTYTLGGTPTLDLLSLSGLVIDGIPVGVTPLLHPNRGGVVTGPFAMLAGNQNFTGDLIGIESTDPSCYSNYIVLGGTAPGNLDVVGFTLTWTGTSLLPVGGSPVTISYMANGSENSQPGGWQTYIASQLGAAMRANATIATNWGVGAVTTTNVVAVENEVAFDVPFPVTNVSQPMTISNACTDAHGGNGNVTLTINSVLTSTTGAMGGAVSTILDTNPSFTITRTVGGRGSQAGDRLGSIGFEGQDSAGANAGYSLIQVYPRVVTPGAPKGTLIISANGASQWNSGLAVEDGVISFGAATYPGTFNSPGTDPGPGSISGLGWAFMGNALMGQWPASSSYAVFGHSGLDQSITGNYAVIQNSSGATSINSASGQTLSFGINNGGQMVLNPSGHLALSGTLGLAVATWADNQSGVVAGQISVDANYIYVATAANTVKRVALSAF